MKKIVTMGKVKLPVHDCYTGKRNIKDVNMAEHLAYPAGAPAYAYALIK